MADQSFRPRRSKEDERRRKLRMHAPYRARVRGAAERVWPDSPTIDADAVIDADAIEGPHPALRRIPPEEPVTQKDRPDELDPEVLPIPPSSGTQFDEEAARLATLTPRERTVCRLAARGLTNKEVGKKLSITPVTVRHHLSSVYSKLQISNRFELIILCYRHEHEGAPPDSDPTSDDS